MFFTVMVIEYVFSDDEAGDLLLAVSESDWQKANDDSATRREIRMENLFIKLIQGTHYFSFFKAQEIAIRPCFTESGVIA